MFLWVLILMDVYVVRTHTCAIKTNAAMPLILLLLTCVIARRRQKITCLPYFTP